MKTISGHISSATYGATEHGREDRTRIAIKFQPNMTTIEKDDPSRPGRQHRVATSKPPAITATIDVSCIKARYRKLSELCGQSMTATIGDDGSIVSLDYSP